MDYIRIIYGLYMDYYKIESEYGAELHEMRMHNKTPF